MSGMIPPPPPPPPSWHGVCFLMSESGQDVCQVKLDMAAPPTRIVLNHGPNPDNEAHRMLSSVSEATADSGVPMDVWLLVGSPLREPLAYHWSAIYQIEEILS